MQFRKRPVVINAMQFDGTQESAGHIVAWVSAWDEEWAKTITSAEVGDTRVLGIRTLEGVMTADPGDWIIRGVKGEFYPCKPQIFAATYRPVGAAMNFGDALEALKAGQRVARAGWNGKYMWLALSPGASNLPADRFWAGPNRTFAQEHGGTADVLPCITMKTADDKILMGWLASQTDMIADDWEVV